MPDAPAPASSRNLHLAALAWGFAEATLFFVVPDVVLGWIAVRRGVRAALLAAVIAALGASVGGAVNYRWSAADPAEAARVIEALPAIPAGAVDRAGTATREGPWLAAATLGSVTNRPFKLFAAAAPHAGVPLAAFMAATPLIRLPRFLGNAVAFALIAALLRRAGWGDRRIAILYGVGWTLFYAAFWLFSPW